MKSKLINPNLNKPKLKIRTGVKEKTFLDEAKPNEKKI